MLKKRIIGTITVKNNWAVQSIQYGKYLPLGRPEVIAENLDRWGVDEIIIKCIDRSKNSLGPDFTTLNNISTQGINTPLIYAGGIETHKQAIDAIKLGADRIMVDHAIHTSKVEIIKAAEVLGSQAVIACLPISLSKSSIFWFDYLTRKEILFTPELQKDILDLPFSEILLVDYKNEGCSEAFNYSILNSDLVKKSTKPILAFGGISTPSLAKRVLDNKKVAAVGIGNFLSYKEINIDRFKTAINQDYLRGANGK